MQHNVEASNAARQARGGLHRIPRGLDLLESRQYIEESRTFLGPSPSLYACIPQRVMAPRGTVGFMKVASDEACHMPWACFLKNRTIYHHLQNHRKSWQSYWIQRLALAHSREPPRRGTWNSRRHSRRRVILMSSCSRGFKQSHATTAHPCRRVVIVSGRFNRTNGVLSRPHTIPISDGRIDPLPRSVGWDLRGDGI